MNRVASSCTCALRAFALPRLSSPSSAVLNLSRSIHAPAAIDATKRIPRPRGRYTDTTSILAASKRGLEQYADKLGDWAELFGKTSTDLKDAGLTTKESRYLLWLLERYRHGHDPAQIAIPATKAKTIRGWGPKVQNGVRVR
ncbi:hypothetical protein JCM8547_001542 [Rhodosporidiobolus lusitaniae]